MSRTTLFLLGFFGMLIGGSTARGQGCATVLQPEFSVYNSVSRDGTKIYTGVTMQGYASIYPNPGCRMNSATHHVGAENKLNNVDHWSYSANGCPTCYFSVTDYEQIVGVPGVEYPWDWDGEAICSIVGSFYGNGGDGGVLGCLVPTTETTDDAGFYGGSYRERFAMTLSDSDADSFDSHYVQEYTVQPGTNTCWWPGSGMAQYPGTQNSSWTVGTLGHNQWGYDSIGWDLSVLDNIVQNGPKNGVTLPCVTTIYQGMEIECDANTWWVYSTDTITITVDADHTEDNCRAGECGLASFSRRIGGRSKTWWARIYNFNSASEVQPRSSPQISAKEGR